MISKQTLQTYLDRLDGTTELAKGDLTKIFDLVKDKSPEDIRDALIDLTPSLVDKYGDMAAEYAARFYEELRAIEYKGSYNATLANNVQAGQIEGSIRYFADDLFNGNCDMFFSKVESLVDRQVLNQARSTIITNTKQDSKRVMYARVPVGVNVCDFCLMVASRGFDYHTKEAAGELNAFHDHCKCQIVPGFGDNPQVEGYDPKALEDEWRARLRGDAASDKQGVIDADVRDLMNNAGIVNVGLTRTNDLQAFSDALREAKENNKFGDLVDYHTADELKGWTLFLTENDLSGVAIKPDGDITCVFKNDNLATKGVVNDLIITARENGGTKMDCYGIDLVNMYERGGYVPVARVPFNPEYVDSPFLLERKPDVYVMMKNDKSTAEVINDFEKRAYQKSSQSKLDSLPTFVDYDNALSYRDNLLEGNK